MTQGGSRVGCCSLACSPWHCSVILPYTPQDYLLMGAPAFCPQWARSFLINCQSRKFLTDTAAGLSGWDRFQLKLPLLLLLLTWQNKPIQVDNNTLTLQDKMIVQIIPILMISASTLLLICFLDKWLAKWNSLVHFDH